MAKCDEKSLTDFLSMVSQEVVGASVTKRELFQIFRSSLQKMRDNMAPEDEIALARSIFDSEVKTSR
jgi:hypothetical protein